MALLYLPGNISIWVMEPVVRIMGIGLLRKTMFEHLRRGNLILCSTDWLGIWIVIRGVESFHIQFHDLPKVAFGGTKEGGNMPVHVGYLSARAGEKERWKGLPYFPMNENGSLGFVRALISQCKDPDGGVKFWSGFQGYSYILLSESNYLVLTAITIGMITDGPAKFPDHIPVSFLRTKGYGIPTVT